MKQCFKCVEWKPISEFYKHKQMVDGHLGKCKDCTKRDVLANRLANIERIRESDRQRSKRPSSRARRAETVAAYYQKYPQRRKAHTAVHNAVRDRKLAKPVHCQVCGQVKRLHGHHHDYSKPLDVIWACRLCHLQLDVERRSREQGK
jgi:hypothetical protein